MKPADKSRDMTRLRREDFRSHLVILKPGKKEELEAQIRGALDIRVVDSREWVPEAPDEHHAVTRAVIFQQLGTALINLPRDELARKFADGDIVSDIRMRSPGFVPGDLSTLMSGSACPQDESQTTWGRKVTGVNGTAFTGKNIRVCVLDSGLAAHPHFQAQGLHELVNRGGRAKVFTHTAETHDTDDTWGHGTHCAGVICGKTLAPPIYSVAPECQLFVADVFGDIKETTLGSTVAAIEWALRRKCEIISMSLYWEEDPTGENAKDLQVNKFKRVVDRAVRQKAILLACTGNQSDRENEVTMDVCFPANLPNVVAVGGINKCKKMLNMGNSGADIAGPGEAVFSAALDLKTIAWSGTSMATPFVAGVAALHAQKDPQARGQKLIDALLASFVPLAVPATDVKTGLVKAP